MLAALGADAVLVVHLAFILFAAFGALLVAWRPRAAVLHLPALAWAIWIELTHGICPLTPLENALRHAAGEAGYAGGFIAHYLVPVIYPAGLMPAHQDAIALGLVAINLLLYGWALFRHLLRRG